MAERGTLSGRLARFVAALEAAQIPGEVDATAKLHTLDLVGTALAAYGIGEGHHAVAASLELGGAGAATVIGEPSGRPAAVAALANGTLAHSIEFDDTHTGSISHTSAVVMPAALAVAEAAGASGRDLLAAIVCGTEVIARIGADAAPAYMRTGFHPTSVCGVFGAAAAACRLRGLDEARTTAAFGIAGSFASGLFEYLGDGTSTKALHAGWAAHAGVTAALLAQAGAEGPARVLEGRFGLFASHFRLEDRDAIGTDWELGTRWETAELSFKPYPACHFVNGALDAARALLGRGVEPDLVDEIVVAVPEPAVALVLEPRATKVRPRTPFEAKFSLQYSLASMLVHGDVDVGTYAPARLREERVLALAERVRHVAEDFPAYPAVLPARVTVRLRDGSEVSEVRPAGSVPPRFAREEVLAKFRANAALALPEAEREQLEGTLLALEGVRELGEALSPLRRVGKRGGPT